MQLNSTQLLAVFAPLSNWQERYRQLILLAKALPAFPEELRTSANQIDGCENRVWLTYQIKPDQTLTFSGDSEGRIVKGLLAVLLMVANHKTAQQIVHTDFLAILKTLNIIDDLSQSRQLGLNNIISRIQSLAINSQCC